MPETLVHSSEDHEIAEQKLWRAVIANTVREWIHGPVRLRRQAEPYRFQNTEDYKQKSLEGKYSWS